MTTESNRGHAPTTNTDAIARERCAGCATTLVEDQRYCLQCGTRRGKPRLDFMAFWKPLSSLTGTQANGPGEPYRPEGTLGIAQDAHATTGGAWLDRMPSRRVAGALAATVLAAGIVAGAALGPTPPSSPADSSTLAERALAALAVQASGSATASATPSSTPGSGASKAAPSKPSHQASSPAVSPAKASAPSSSENAPSSESTANGPSSEGSPPEGTSSKGTGESEKAAPGTPVKLPPVKHVWVIALSGMSFADALARAQANPYLAKQLVPQGTLLSAYTLTAPSALANGIALLAGQGVNLDTEHNCPTYGELQPPTVNAANGLAGGLGCIYPKAVQTLADELTAAGLTWRAYVQGMESAEAGAPTGTSSTSTSTSTASQPGSSGVSCRRPEPGAPDPNQAPMPGNSYLTFRNPFVYFHSLLDGGACASNDVDLERLRSDLATPTSTPSLNWIVPSACDDGSSSPCTPGAPDGLGAADSFLKEVVPQILATAAYRKEGLIAIVPDSAPAASASAAAKPVGALLLSPFVHSGVHVSEPLNDFSLLKSLSRLFGVLPLGHANDPSAVSLGATVYSTTK
jgi:phosphatidylinositol-3-phosphatase